MGQKFDKFLLLMWKNCMLQYRKPIQTLFEILVPLLFSFVLVLFRSLADPIFENERIFNPFCTVSTHNEQLLANICPNVEGRNHFVGAATNINISILYTPSTSQFDKPMSYFNLLNSANLHVNVTGVGSSNELEQMALNENSIYIGIQFDGQINDNLKAAIRFPSELNDQSDSIIQDWKTNLIYPTFQSAGPRSPNNDTGSVPNYYSEGFLMVQHFLTISLLLDKFNCVNNLTSAVKCLFTNKIPIIHMKRFPYASWYSDIFTTISSMLGLIVMLSFLYTCINTVKSITAEKEKQLKESMKIMGLSSWLHWLAWFVKCFIFLTISAALMVVLFKVKWYSHTNFTVFTHADPTVLFVFLLLYACSTITYCFALSVLFSKANTAATMAGLSWFLSYTPYLFMQNNYSSLSLSTKLLSSLLTNTGMAFGFQIVLMYEGTGDGIQWSNLFTPNTPDDDFSLGLVWIMFIINSIMYLFIALYIEAVFPGEFGVPQKWYFIFTKKFWCGQTNSTGSFNREQQKKSEYFETEPANLKAGIQIFNLGKRFGKKVAVRDLSLSMYENQITVLLGHNGAGKTTTMLMLTGMITPTTGTAIVNGHDIRVDMELVRGSLGLFPQHNIIFDDLTVAEHIYFFSKLKGLSKSEVNAEIDKYVKLLDF